jgi:magnesium chelatase family protein
MDRIDLQIEVPALSREDLAGKAQGESSAAIRERVERARSAQLARQGKSNARLAAREIARHCTPNGAGVELLKQAIARLGLSARAYDRVLKVARTIADLSGAARIDAAHVAEAIQYRRFDRGTPV